MSRNKRAETLDWLLRPFMAALAVTLIVPGFAALRLYTVGDAALREVLFALPASLFIIAGLLIYGIHRMVATAQGRAAPPSQPLRAEAR